MATIKTFGEFNVTPDTTRDDLHDTLVDEIKTALENACDSDILDLLNEWRESNCYDTLREMCEDEINDALDGYTAWDVLQMEIDTTDDYFCFDGYCDITTTCDVWHDCDSETIAKWIAENEDAHGVSEIETLLDDYNDALDALEEMEDEDEDEDAKARAERLQARAKEINHICDSTIMSAISFYHTDAPFNAFSDEYNALKIALLELYNAVEGRTS